MSKPHVDIYRRSDPVMYLLEDRGEFDRIFYGRTDGFSTAKDLPCWQISCMYYDGSVLTTLFANDAKYNAVWDDRVNYFSFLPPGAAFPAPTFSGTVSVTNPIDGGKITTVALTNAAWIPVPAVATAMRQGVGIQNLSGGDILLNWNNAAPPTEGIIVRDGSERYYTAKTSAVIYARLTTLTTGNITVEELY